MTASAHVAGPSGFSDGVDRTDVANLFGLRPRPDGGLEGGERSGLDCVWCGFVNRVLVGRGSGVGIHLSAGSFINGRVNDVGFAFFWGLIAFREKCAGADETTNGDCEPDAEDSCRNECLLADAVEKFADDMIDGFTDFVLGLAAGIGKEFGGRRRVADFSKGSKRESVVLHARELYMGVVLDPGQAFLESGNLQPDQAVEDVFDGVVENGATKGAVQGGAHLVDEFVEGAVDGACCSIDPAKNVVVDLVIELVDCAVNAT